MAQNFLRALPTQGVGPKGQGASGEKAAAGTPTIEPETGMADPERWVDEYGDYLFKHALIRLRDPIKAEDMVQETFLVALKSGDTFAGRASAKSWPRYPFRPLTTQCKVQDGVATHFDDRCRCINAG